MEIGGNTQGLKKSQVQALEDIYGIELPQNMIWTRELIDKLCGLTGAINREIAVYSDRKGRIINVIVGDYATVSLDSVEESAALQGFRASA